ncbi:MAG TPA: alcohol dehydrogenase catalytic domain-containing protein, partial [Actinomycetota bacterium]|nr:alcohol dehydrogenase catalytic domain-containing protein [Actinomycetota bacterium]
MDRTGRGAVLNAPGEPVTIEDVTLDPPGPDEVQVRIVASGVCHTDLHVKRTNGWGMAFPILLGHEGAGYVEDAGENVHGVALGDPVVIAWRAPCGSCRSCRRGRPWYCFDSANARQPMTLADGTPLSPA